MAGPSGDRETETSPTGIGWRTRDHTQGSLVVSLFVLAAPLFLSSVLGGAAFQLFDLTFLSRLGEAPLAAVVIVNQTVRQAVMMLLMGVGFGTQALVARSIGEGRVDRAEHFAGQAFVLGLVFSTGVAVLGLTIPEWLFRLAGPNESFVPYGVPYLRLVFLLNFGFMAAGLFNNILGAAGDTTTPLFVHLVQSAIAIVAEWVLIFGHLGAPALGVQGTALGIACGHFAAIAIGASVLLRGRSRIHLRARHFRPDPVALGQILRLSWPTTVGMGGGVVMTLIFLRLAGGFGEHVQAAYSIGLRLSFIVPIVCFPIATSCATLVGQALGAGDVPRAWRSVRTTLVVHSSLMLSFAFCTFWFRTEIMSTFSDEPEVIRVGSEFLLYASGTFATWAFQFVFMRSLQGAGDVVVPMVISLAATFGVAIPLAIGLSATQLGPTGIWIANLANSVVSTLALGGWLATGRWTRRGKAR